MRTLLNVFVLLLTAACSTSGHRTSPIPPAELLSDATIGLPRPAAVTVSRDDAMALDDEMRAFVEAAVGKTHQKTVVLTRLVRGMKEHGFFTVEYVVGDTHTARDTFRTQRANCISFTLLFVALARESGLRTSFQIVDVPPVWTADVGLTVIANHINALIETPSGRDFVIDFNETSFNARYEREKISDAHALSLFFNNLGAEALLRQEHALAFHYFKEAIAIEPDVADAWVNLGLLYARLGRHEHAEAAYLHALEITPSQRSALTNLAHLYETLGNQALADVYNERIRSYQQRNPYYHYVVAQQAFDEDRLEAALESMNRAIRLKGDEHDFYYLLGLTQMELGELAAATSSLRRAREHAYSNEQREKYDAALASVRAAQPAVLETAR